MTVAAPKVFVAGYKGMAGSAIVRRLLAQGHPSQQLITRTHDELELTNQAATSQFFAYKKPDQVYLAAATVGGMHATIPTQPSLSTATLWCRPT